MNDLQNIIPFGRLSTSDNTDPPVVVKPDVLSNIASAKPGITPEIIKGKEPNKEAMIQQRATINKPSRIFKSKDFGLFIYKIIKPEAIRIIAGIMKTIDDSL